MGLDELITQLIEEHGLTVDEATQIAAARLKAERRSPASNLSRTNPNNFPVSAQQYANGVNYGNETPAEARERWIRQEMNDPNGIYGGGATSGGVFGDGAIATDHWDPVAVQRNLNMQAQLTGVQTQAEMLQLMREMREELQGRRELPPRQPKNELNDGRGPLRRLGFKKRGRE